METWPKLLWSCKIIFASVTKLRQEIVWEFCVHVSLGKNPIKNILATVQPVIAVFIDIQKDSDFLLRRQKSLYIVNLL